VAIAVHPDDERYAALIGRRVRVPLPGFSRAIPLIADDAVEIEFGSGALKVTPGHDPLDFEIGARHGLESIRVIDWDGTMTEDAGVYVGLTREEARERVAADLEESGWRTTPTRWGTRNAAGAWSSRW
jgi:valyl-tRNA synthetase